MQALFLTRYGRRGASSRYRVLQYLPFLTARGWEAEWQPLLPDEYVENLYSRGRRSLSEVCRAYGRRLRYLRQVGLRRFDAIYVQQEVFPYAPAWVETALLARARRVLLDYDDATFISYRSKPFLNGKIDAIMRAANRIIVGSEYLAEYARRQNRSVSVVPTVVDLARYSPRPHYACSETHGFVIGWIGTPVTARYLSTLSGILQHLARRHPLILRTIGTPPGFSIPGVTVENVPWSEATETGIIRTFDAGVMPLADEPFAAGKCGLKLIQYMASGVPAVGARLGANTEIIRDGEDGFLAGADREYVDILERLIRDRGLREKIGRAGRRRVESQYSLQARAEEFCSLLESTAHA